ncbi:MAG: 4-alpha-glucanotransferase [Acidimicrobiales bacterium]
MTGTPLPAPLKALAALKGVQTRYLGADGTVHEAGRDQLAAVLRAMGSAIERAEDADDVLRAEADDRTHLEPVLVARADDSIELPQGQSLELRRTRFTLTLEDGHSASGAAELLLSPPGSGGAPTIKLGGLAGEPIPEGYHELAVEGPRHVERALLIKAPRCPRPKRGWGGFLPIYALRSESDWGIGSFPDLCTLGDLLVGKGASFVATLPLYPVFTDSATSPYLPVTRLGLSELYVDPCSIPELMGSDELEGLLLGRTSRIENARRSELVDYHTVSRLRREVLAPLSAQFVQELARFGAAHPELLSYAAFRAAGERFGRDWHDWGPEAKAAAARTQRFDDPRFRYHLFSQWLANRQLREAARRVPLYCDMPLGVHPNGFDPFLEPEAFCQDASVGAPPDAFRSEGQDWSCPPIHPGGIRQQRYRHLIAVLRTAMSTCSILRLDHVMSLHRLWWIPRGFEAADGVYVSYRPDEIYAIVALEAARAGVVVVGEDLGTVPGGVREAMADHGVLRSWVFQFESSIADPVPQAPPGCLASLGTHDLPRMSTLLGADGEAPGAADGGVQAAVGEKAWRAALLGALGFPAAEEMSHAILLALLEELARSPADLVLVDIGELLGESQPDNTPGAPARPANWAMRARMTLEAMAESSQLVSVMTAIGECRSERAPRRAKS